MEITNEMLCKLSRENKSSIINLSRSIRKKSAEYDGESGLDDNAVRFGYSREL